MESWELLTVFFFVVEIISSCLFLGSVQGSPIDVLLDYPESLIQSDILC